MEKESKKVCIIGAGPAGLTAAYELAKQGIPVDVYEASGQVGGMSKTIELWDQKVDLGPHRFFSSDTRVNKLWLEVIGKDYRMVDRLTRIYYKRKFFYYPLKPFDALKKLGLGSAALCMLSYLRQRIAPARDEGNFESWVTRRFGKRLYRIFFKTYSEKLWGIPCTQLDSDFAAQRIKKLSLWEAIKNGFSSGGGSKHKTLVDQFAYPLGGTGQVYERMKDFVNANGGSVKCNEPISGVAVEDGAAVGIKDKDGNVIRYDHIISSMPLTHMVKSLPDVPDDIKQRVEKLKFRNTILVYLKVASTELFPDNWLYVHSDDLQMGRITNFRNWVPELYGNDQNSIVVLEYWCYDEDDMWKRSDDELIELAKKEIVKTGLVNGSDIREGYVHHIPKCYPVYDMGYKENLKPVENFLSDIPNLSVIGRYGAFKYNNQDHSILMGVLAAENIIQQRGHDLWEINTDYDDYQERSAITESGLVSS